MRQYLRETPEGEIDVWPFDLADLRAEGIHAHDRTDVRSLARHRVQIVHQQTRPADEPGKVWELEMSPQKRGPFWVREWVQREMPPDQFRTAKIAELAEARWAREVGGITLPDGTRIRTDRVTQAALTSAMASVQAGTITETDWKLESGWITLRGPQIVAIAGAVARHVKACFRAERVVHEAVDEVTDVSAAFDTAYAAAMAVGD